MWRDHCAGRVGWHCHDYYQSRPEGSAEQERGQAWSHATDPPLLIELPGRHAWCARTQSVPINEAAMLRVGCQRTSKSSWKSKPGASATASAAKSQPRRNRRLRNVAPPWPELAPLATFLNPSTVGHLLSGS